MNTKCKGAERYGTCHGYVVNCSATGKISWLDLQTGNVCSAPLMPTSLGIAISRGLEFQKGFDAERY